MFLIEEISGWDELHGTTQARDGTIAFIMLHLPLKQVLRLNSKLCLKQPQTI